MNIENILYLGEEYQITDYIKIRQPTLGEMFKNEDRYYSLLNKFVSTPFDMIAQLDMNGIDFTKITPYQLFCMLVPLIDKSESAILFGDTDFTKYRFMCDSNENIMLSDGKSYISEPIYILISDYLRKMNNLQPPKYKKVGNEMTKKKLIEYAYDDLKKSAKKKNKSPLLNYVSFVVANTGCRYNEVWELPIFVFFDTVKRLNANKHTEILYYGLYSGNVDFSKINKKDLDFMRNLD